MGKKQLNFRFFGMNTITELFQLVSDTVSIVDGVVVTTPLVLAEFPNLSIFVKLTEESRRERQRRIDAGDETVRLKFSVLAEPQHEEGLRSAAGKGGKPARPWQSTGEPWQWQKGAGAWQGNIAPKRPGWQKAGVDAGVRE